MYFRKSRGYDHHLGSYVKALPELEESTIRELAKTHRLGSTAGTTSKLADAHLRIVLSIASSYYHHDKEELFSVAAERMLHAIRAYPLATPRADNQDNITSYIAGFVRSGIEDFIQRSKPIPMSREKRRRGLKTVRTVKYIDHDDILEPESWDEVVSSLELKELVAQLKPSDGERHIIALAYAGYNRTEIADAIGVSQPTATKRIKAIAVRLKRILDEQAD